MLNQQKVKQTIKELRDSGFAVVIFYPEECGSVNPRILEEFLVNEGNYFLEVQEEAEANI